MSVSLRKPFLTLSAAHSFADEKTKDPTAHHIVIGHSDDSEMPYEVEWVEECNLEDRYEIHPPTY